MQWNVSSGTEILNVRVHNISLYFSLLFKRQCPDDDTLLDGSSCYQNEGTCFHGTCTGAQQQCIELWGEGAKVAHESCYTNFNPTGSMTGHCGYDSRLNKYIPCFDK